MRNLCLRYLPMITLLICWIPKVDAAPPWFAAPFSADITLTATTDPTKKATGKIYVTHLRFRAEGNYNGEEKIVLLDAQQQQTWTLLPHKRHYHKGAYGPMPPAPDIDILPEDRDSPCTTAASSGISCKKLATETLHGITTDKWDIVTKTTKEQTRMLLWVDPKRHLMIRQQIDLDGPFMERRLLGIESVAGRETERWEFAQVAQKEQHKYMEWVDVKLRLPIRTSGQHPFNVEITNIREGAIDEQLFRLPTGFQEIAPPQPPQPTTHQP